MKDNIQKLVDLHNINSKHSSYQQLPSSLIDILKNNEIVINSRFERERFNFCKKYFEIKDKNMMDIGGNTGFFSFELLKHGAGYISFYEGNSNHAEFVRKASEIIGCDNKILVHDEYFDFINYREKIHFDVVLLFNVIHHIGDDYGLDSLVLSTAKELMIQNINFLADKTEYLCFQMGYNWRGNKSLPIFENGTKAEMIAFIEDGVSEKWNIVDIGIPERNNGEVIYKKISEDNVSRNDELGEFLNRPLFILKSK